MISIRRRLASLIALALPVATTSCGDGLGLPEDFKPAAITIVSGNAQSAPVGVKLSQPLVVRVVDGGSRPVEGQSVAFTIGAGGGQIAPANATTGSDGMASATWTLGALAGQQQVQARVSGDDVPATLLVSFSATAVSGAGARLVLVSGDNQTAAVGSALPDSLVVRVTDELDNPVGGVEVTWTVGGGGSIAPGTVVSDANGLAAAERVLGNASGTQTAQASSSDLTPVTFTHMAEPANPTALVLISGDAQTAPAGTTLAQPLVVRLVDDNGNGVGGKAITWVLTPGNGSVNPENVSTSPTGFAQTSWTLGTGSGSNVVNAVFSGLPSVPFTATGTAGAATKLSFTQAPVTTPAGSTITPAVKVAIQDAGGNTTSATNAVTLAIGSNPGGGTLSGTLTVSAVNGVATFSNLSINRSGNGYTLTAAAGGLTGVASPTFDIVPGDADRLVFITQPTDRVVGQKFSPAVQVQVQDAGGNPVLVGTGTITVTSSVTGTLTGTATATPILGTATFNNLAVNKAAVGYTLTALASGVSSATSTSFDVTQASTTIQITGKSPGGNSVFGQPVQFNYDINIEAPGAGSLSGTVTVTDGTDSCNGAINVGTGVGSCQILFTSPGTRSVTATYNGDQNFVGSTSSSVNHTVNKANTQLTITSDAPEPSDPGESVHVEWTLSPSGAGAGTPTGTVTVTGGAGVTPCNVSATFGTSSCDLVFPTSGNKTINASYSGDANFNGSNDNEPHTVTTPNVPPTATADGYSMLEDETLDVSAGNGVLDNDDDPDNGPSNLVARNFSTPAHGTLTPAGNGSFTYTPDPNYNGIDTFTYEAFDGAAADQATVTITITAVNDAPSFTPGGDVTVLTTDPPYSQPWATNGSAGPANESGQALNYVVTVDAFGQALFTIDGQPSIAPDGTLSFTPSGFIGQATVTVNLQDDGGTANGGVDSTGDQEFKIIIN